MSRFYVALNVVVVFALVGAIALLLYWLAIKMNAPIKDYYSAGGLLVLVTLLGIWINAKYRRDDRIDKKLSGMASVKYVDEKIDTLKEEHKYTRDAVDEFREIFEQNFSYQKNGITQIQESIVIQNAQNGDLKTSLNEVKRAITNLNDNCIIHTKKK